MGSIKNTIRSALFLPLASCALFSGEEIDGCMYLGSRSVDVKCINAAIEFSARNPGAYYPIKSFDSCVSSETAQRATASSTIFLGEGGQQSVRAACLFEGSDSRNYYRWEENKGRLYVRYLSCASGCVSISDLYDLEFSEEGIKATLLATKKE
ncbi:MAG: hypothetical protein LBI17_02290 [Rickettsiales bacterium]|jgi:hypothetical protein|nr:hypothetical protein [Rickettsiales bacterium]